MSWILSSVPAVLAAAAVVLLLPGRPRPASALFAPPATRRRPGVRVPGLVSGPLLGTLVVGAALGLGVRGVHVGLVTVTGLAVAGLLHLAAGARRTREAETRRQQVVDYCEALVGELRAGQPVGHALERALEVWPEARPVVAAARIGAEVPAALRRLATLPGAHGVTRLSGAWELCAATGSGLAFAVEQVLATARAEQATARLVQGELASARATARLVTALPLVVLLAAQGIGARPWEFLVGTTAGVACLGLGVALALVGLWWIDRIAAAAAEGGG
jgi:tight adherence protein B